MFWENHSDGTPKTVCVKLCAVDCTYVYNVCALKRIQKFLRVVFRSFPSIEIDSHLKKS